MQLWGRGHEPWPGPLQKGSGGQWREASWTRSTVPSLGRPVLLLSSCSPQSRGREALGAPCPRQSPPPAGVSLQPPSSDWALSSQPDPGHTAQTHKRDPGDARSISCLTHPLGPVRPPPGSCRTSVFGLETSWPAGSVPHLQLGLVALVCRAGPTVLAAGEQGRLHTRDVHLGRGARKRQRPQQAGLRQDRAAIRTELRRLGPQEGCLEAAAKPRSSTQGVPARRGRVFLLAAPLDNWPALPRW